jgi:hypothetical protein
MNEVRYAFDAPPGEERSDNWISDLSRFFPDRVLEILEAPDVEHAESDAAGQTRRPTLAKG